LLLAVSLLPLLTLVNQDGEAPWHLWVPALAQLTLMGRVLKGEPVAAWDYLLPLLVCAALALLCLAFVARRLRRAAAG
jgi:sodium transport system permease protein